jgi:hypothetical protein
MKRLFSDFLALVVLVGITFFGVVSGADEDAGEQVEEIEMIEEIVEMETVPGIGMKIPMVWPIHAVLAAYCAVLLIISVLIARNRSKDTLWLAKHKTLGMVVVGIMLIGFGVAFYMVSLGSKGHFTIGHSYLGLAAIIFICAVPTFGLIMLKVKKSRVLRKIHVWAGRLTITLMIIAGGLGLYHVGLI